MKKIDVTQENYRVLTALEKDVQLGRIIYTKWYSNSKSEITVGNKELYTMVPKGFWQSKLEILHGDVVVLKTETKFSGYTMSRPIDPDRPYKIKHKGFFKNGYIVVNYKDEVLLEISPNFSWRKMYPGYTIACADTFGNDDFEKLLIMLSVHYCRNMQNAAAASATNG
ncbi:hypothetical protein R1T16_16625 [Flavobacterium sp. DG1-102-2]|uniref:hypothetical protein n=1 Tax=Flavobacterium sp. DG1-102-2 TaxID=3081663 RepID=UPI0029497AEC|nr:hypothetical protein [Flavobacterium sp. DG1-102-2]MDV6170065.1 hypothetical protein [Flavobacterium sp. DG1-102-2]